MAKPRYNWQENNVLARCPDCDAMTSFDAKGHSNTSLGTVIINAPHRYANSNYSRVLWQFFRCNVGSRGAVAKIHDSGNSQTAVLEDFIPQALEKASLPPSVPEDIAKEFREAELDAAHGAYRSASAMLRSVLEKTLKKNGYEEVEIKDEQGNLIKDKEGKIRKSQKLIHRIDAAAEDGIITETRQKRAHENIRVLGNDVLHDDWREVTQEEFEEAHKYAQRLIEDFYDDRPTVAARLTAQGRSS
jgi:Arc/MetJ-type ribon-helix-helix transcriptional regulator